MALFRKKKKGIELDFPDEPIALDEQVPSEGPLPLPEQPELPPLPTFKEEKFEPPRAYPLPPKPIPRPIRIRKEMSGPRDVDVTDLSPSKPYMYIKVSKYKELVNKVNHLRSVLADLEKETRELARKNSLEREKISSSERILDRLDDLITYLESTFVRPGE